MRDSDTLFHTQQPERLLGRSGLWGGSLQLCCLPSDPGSQQQAASEGTPQNSPRQWPWSPQEQTESLSLADIKADEKSSCTLPEGTSSSPQEIDPSKENQLYFTYSVHWEVRRGWSPWQGRRVLVWAGGI